MVESESDQNKLGQYRLLERIAQGGMAEVYKAKTVDVTGVERLVVIKRILSHISSQPEYVDMLIDEAKIAVHFTHGNIAQIYDLGRVKSDYFIVMEYVDGKTLSQIYKALNERHQKIPLDILLYCFVELCRGLSYIHRKTGPTGKKLGVIHRDVSPQNIILSYAGNVKIIDFGVAKADFMEEKTEAGVLKGKFAYMSPEQTHAERLDHRSDLFSVGILLWEMSTGERLFKRKSNRETIKAVRKAKFDLPSQKRADIPKGLDKMIKKALQKLPRFRYQDAGDMALDLEKLLYSINPDFRPINAAKFLYDLFGPEEDERHLPAPFFVKPKMTPGEKTGKSFQTKSGTGDTLSGHSEVPTLKEQYEEATPLLSIRRIKRHSSFLQRVLMGVMSLIFLGGSVYAYFVHLQGQRAFLRLDGVDPTMQIFLNDEAFPVSQEEIQLKNHVAYRLKILKKDFKPFEKNFELDAKEHLVIPIHLEKIIPPYGDVTVVTDPPGAVIYLDEKEWGEKTPLTLKGLHAEQKYKLGFYLPNYKFLTREIEILRGKEIKIEETLLPDYASLALSSDPPGAEVFLDDQKKGETPLVLNNLLPEKVLEIKIIHPQALPQATVLQLKPGEEATRHFQLKFK